MTAIFVDDHRGDAEGRGGRFTLAVDLEDEAEAFEEFGTAYGAVLAASCRALAAEAREQGILTAEAFLERYRLNP